MFSIQNVRGGFIVVVLMCLGRFVQYHVGMSVCRICLGHICSVEERLECKRWELTVADEARLRRVDCCMIRIMWGGTG